MYEYIIALVAGSATTAALILLEHILCWHQRLPLAARYALGVAAICLGVIVAASIVARWEMIITWGVIVLVAGITTLALHWRRSLKGERTGEDEATFQAGRLAGHAEEGANVASRTARQPDTRHH